MNLQRLLLYARPPHAVLVRHDLMAAGVSRHTWRRAIDQGLLQEVMPKVAVAAGRPITSELELIAAVYSVGDQAVLSHRSAARVWGVEGLPDHPIDVTRTDPRQRQCSLQRPGVMVHRPADLADLRPLTVNDLPVTNPVRTLLDLGAVAPDAVDRALTHFRVTRRLPLSQVREALERHGAHGRTGVAALRQALAEQQLDELPPDSQLEERMARLVSRYGLPPMQFHARLATFEVDFWIIGTPLYLECDGWAYHGLQRDQFEFDRARTAALSAAGFVGVRVTWRQVTRDPQHVADLVWRNVARWAPHLLG
jgi:very-short-patch-repair endonuclease